MSDAQNAGPDAPQDNEKGHYSVVTPDKADDAVEPQPEAKNDNADGDSFPRTYVEELRKESASHRHKADDYAKRLHAEIVKATGRLENPADLPYDAKHLDDAEALTAALDALLTDRPYLAKRVVKGDVGQGHRGGAVGGPSWADLFNGGAG